MSRYASQDAFARRIPKGGIGLQFSADKIKFTSLREPLSVLDPGTWARSAASELIPYHVLLDAKTGTNQLSNAWLMAYMYIQPNEGFDKRYLVIRSVTVTVSNSPVNPQVGVLLARWYNAKLHDHWSTTAPAPPDGGSVYQLEAKSGYLLTRADPTKATVELEDCVSHWPGHPDHILKHKGNCEAAQYQRLRSVGWAYSARQPGSQPLYACYADAEKSHFASSREDCEGLGAKGTLLGYDLKE